MLSPIVGGVRRGSELTCDELAEPLDPTAVSVSDFMRFDFTESFSYLGLAVPTVGQLTFGIKVGEMNG